MAFGGLAGADMLGALFHQRGGSIGNGNGISINFLSRPLLFFLDILETAFLFFIGVFGGALFIFERIQNTLMRLFLEFQLLNNFLNLFGPIGRSVRRLAIKS